jgi:putative transposase
VIHLKQRYRLWLSRRVYAAAICAGNFAQDARGRWYLDVQLEAPQITTCGAGAVAIDLGIKTLARLSDRRKIEKAASRESVDL